MARLEQVITNIVDIFLEYADDEGKKRQLNKEELKKVLEQEIQSPDLKVRDSTHSPYIKTFYTHHSGVLLCILCCYLTVLSRIKSVQMTSEKPWKCWIRTTMARSTSESFVGVCVSWPNATTRRRQARVAREGKAKNKKMSKKTEEPQTLKMFVAP